MIDQLLKRYPIISDQVSRQELLIILAAFQRTLDTNIDGDVVEFGCYAGTTSLFIQRLLLQNHAAKAFHVYDSFIGLPEKTEQDRSVVGEQFMAGELAVSKADFVRNFKNAHVPLPVIHKAWFEDLRAQDVPDQICFAFLDGDYYESIRDSLRLTEDKLSDGAVIVIDDYMNEALPGAAKAVDEWLAHKAYKLRTQASLAIIQT